jgi:hypothetical protein
MYVDFLQNNSDLLKDKFTRKVRKVFQRMSQAIPSRIAEQCRTHHQKMLKRFQCIGSIIENCR